MIPEEVTNLLDKTGDTMIMEVEKGAIKRYADAIGDYNPLYWDDDYAKNSRYDSIIAPPGFFGWPTKWITVMPISSELYGEARAVLVQIGYGRVLDGGVEYEFLCPVRAGDALAAVEKIADISEREGKTGKMVFMTLETTYTNQNGDLAAKARSTIIYR